jgi:hypothetical protein
MTPAAQRLDQLCKVVIQEQQPEKSRMSTLDKMALLRQRRDELNKTLDVRAQALLDRYDAADKKADQAFGLHNSRLDAEETELAEVEAAIDRMSNSGNLPGSEQSSV